MTEYITDEGKPRPGRVLLVHANPTVRDRWRVALEASGQLVESLAAPGPPEVDGVPAPQVVLLGELPAGMTLAHALSALAEGREEGHPAVLITRPVDGDEATWRHAQTAGVTDFVANGASDLEVVHRVRQALWMIHLAALADRGRGERLYLADLTAQLNQLSDEEAIINALAKALERFDLARLMLLWMPPDAAPTLWSVGARPTPEGDPDERTLVRRIAQHTESAEPPQPKYRRHIERHWPTVDPREPLRALPLIRGEVLRGMVGVRSLRPLAQSERLLLTTAVDRLTLPLESARLFSNLSRRNEELKQMVRTLHSTQAGLVASERMASIGQLAAGLAHEINNPLSFLVSNIDILEEYLTTLTTLIKLYQADEMEKARALFKRSRAGFMLEDLDEIFMESREGAHRVQRIVADLRAFAHPAGSDAARVDMQEVLESTLNILHGDVKRKAAVRRDFKHAPPVKGDPARLRQMCLNLIVNAAQAIPPQSDGVIDVRCFPDEDGVVVEVVDNGEGIADDVQASMFQPFFTTKEETIGGSGLGLTIVDDVVRQHKGLISVESMPGRGARFRVWLPPAEEARLQKSTVLFIDDERFLLNAYRRAYGRTARVILALGGQEGVKALQQHPEINLVLCDLLMPEFSGADVYQWVSEHRPELLQHFVIVTAGQHDDQARRFLDETDLPVMFKPFNMADLTQLIEQHLRPL